MDLAAALGVEVNARAGLIRPALRTWGGPYSVRHAVALLLVLGSSPLFVAEKYAVIITGASGGEVYAKKYDAWRRSLATTLGGRLGSDAKRGIQGPTAPSRA